MITLVVRAALVMLLACGCLPASSAQGVDSAMRRAEERQMVEETGARAQYSRAVKEANAAYAEAVGECGRMTSRQRASCMQEAKANLKADLASARAQSGEDVNRRR